MMLLLACVVLASRLAVAEIKSGGWRPVVPHGESERHLAVSYHTVHGGGVQSLPPHYYHQLGETLAAEDSRGQDHCALYKVSFIQDLYFQYIQYKTSLPDFKEFTICLWHKFYNHSNDHPLFSYAVPNQPRAIYLWVSNSARSSYFSLSVDSHTFFRLNYPLRLNRWYHSCTSWNGRSGEWQIWVNAERVGRGFHNRLVGHVIPGGGIAITGQEQRQFGGGFLEGDGSPKGSGGLLGEVTQLFLYKAALAAGKAHRDHKHHHGNHASSTTPQPPPVSTGPPLPSHPLLVSGQLIPQLNINAQLGGGLRPQNPPPPPGNPLLTSSLLQHPGGSTSSISLPGVSSFSIQHTPGPTGSAFGDSSPLASQQDSGSLLDIQHSLFKRDKERDTSVAVQGTTAARSKRSTSPYKNKFPPKKYFQATEDQKHNSELKELDRRSANEAENKQTIHKVIKRTIDFSDDDDGNGQYFESQGSSLLGNSAIELLGGDFNPISTPQQQDDDDLPSTGEDYPREPAEGEVTQVMNVCSACAPEPFKKAELISWKNTPKKLYSGALYTLANPVCRRF